MAEPVLSATVAARSAVSGRAAPAAAPGNKQPRVAPQPDPILDQIARQLIAELRPQRLYLFGSRARGDNDGASDYDVLAVVDAERDQLRELQRRGYSVLWDVDAAVDVLVMTAPYFDRQGTVVATLPATVLREGKLLYAA